MGRPDFTAKDCNLIQVQVYDLLQVGYRVQGGGFVTYSRVKVSSPEALVAVEITRHRGDLIKALRHVGGIWAGMRKWRATRPKSYETFMRRYEAIVKATYGLLRARGKRGR